MARVSQGLAPEIPLYCEQLGGSGSSTSAADFEFGGTTRYEILSRLGTGGMGVVYKVFDRETATHVALKALHARKPDALLRFKNEFRSLQGIRHPNLVKLGELGEAEGTWYFTMELVEGVDFLTHVRARSNDPGGVQFHEGRLRQALAQLARGLGALHAAGKIHRDVKPLNIRINDTGRLALLDFGLVIDVEKPDRLSEGWVIGTAAYMAPEQAHADATVPGSDFYAMGSLMYHALTGRVPFEGGDLEVLMRKQREMPPPPSEIAPGVPADLEDLCMDLLQCDREERPSELEVLRRLGDVGETTPLRRSDQGDRRGDFVGREREVGAMLSALAPPRAARTAIIRGASGVGKTALLEHVLAEVARAVPEAVVLSGRCYENESVPFKGVDGVVDALTNYMRALPREQAAALLPRNASLLAQVFPVLRRVDVIVESPRVRGDTKDAQTLRRRAFSALRELFTRIAVRLPLVIAVDDLQWADRDSLTLLADLMQPPEQPPLLLVVATRPRADAEGTEPLDVLPGRVERYEIGPLPPEAAARLAAALMRRYGVAGSDEDAETLAEEAGSHPMFLRELVAHVASVGMDQRRMVKLDDALHARFHKLPAPARKILELVCVAGAPISQQTVAFAAGLEFGDYLEQLFAVRDTHLVRTAGGRRPDTVEPYHNRIRDAALRTLSEREKIDYHRALADALEATGEAEQSPERVLHHLTAAGLDARAAYHAEIAAVRAVEGLAFDRAAAHYRAALRLGNDDETTVARLQLALAGVLCHAGRGPEAVDIFLAMADGAPAPLRLEYRRRAMEQLLFSGHVERGLSVVRLVLEELGDTLPRTQRRALLALVWERLKLRMRGLGWRERDEAELKPKDLARVDVYMSIGAGLGMVDNIRGADYQCKGLRHALELGERSRVVRALAVEGVFAAAQPQERRCRTIIDKTRAMADESKDPIARAYSLFPQAAVHYFIENRWREAWNCMSEVERLFHAHVQSGGWETDTAQMYNCFCMMYLGELREMRRRAAQYRRDAERRGDLYASTNLRTRLILCWVLDDDARGGERDVDEALRAWSTNRDTFQVQHFYELHSRCELALYAGDPQRAASQMAQRLAGLKSSMMLRLPIIAGEIGFLRGRIALAQAERLPRGSDRAMWLKETHGYARRLLRIKFPIGRALAMLLRAGAARIEDDQDTAVRELRAAIEELEDLETMLYVYPARRRLGEMIGGDAGAELVESADQWFEQQDARNPVALSRMLLGY